MKKSIKKVIGASMIAMLFMALFVYFAITASFSEAVTGFAIAICLVVFISVAAYLISE